MCAQTYGIRVDHLRRIFAEHCEDRVPVNFEFSQIFILLMNVLNAVAHHSFEEVYPEADAGKCKSSQEDQSPLSNPFEKWHRDLFLIPS